MSNDPIKDAIFCNGLIHIIPPPDLCPSKGNIDANICEKQPQINSTDEEPLRKYQLCDICFPS